MTDPSEMSDDELMNALTTRRAIRGRVKRVRGATNVSMRLDGDRLLIEVDLSKSLGPSESGKSVVVATTRGGVAVPGAGGALVKIDVFRPKTHSHLAGRGYPPDSTAERNVEKEARG